MRPEAARERDLHRYYKPWKDAQNSLVDLEPDERGSGDGLTYEGYKPRTSGDKTLTAFAQLAALRLNVRRAMVSLIDSSQQYILAEATQTLSLVSDQRHKPGDEVWLGNTILRRSDAVCGHCFGHKCTGTNEDGSTYTTDGMIVPNLTLDDRFKNREYVKQEGGLRFYAGVPIKTKHGHQIGVYAVSDERTRHGLTVDELIFMEDVAAAVMDHLELAKDRDARMNGERMVRGLADFIEGTGDEQEVANSTGVMTVTTGPEESQPAPRRSVVMRRQSENAQRMLDDVDDVTRPSLAEKSSSQEPSSGLRPTKSTKSRPSRDDPSRILARAARIIRQSTDADGVIFFNTSSRNFQGLGRRHHKGSNTDISSGFNSGSEGTTDSVSTIQANRHRHTDSTDSGEDLHSFRANDKPRRTLCEVVGLSISQHEQYGRLGAKDFPFPEENMEKYIKNFPYGKFFSFTDTGSGISSGDELSSEERPNQSQPPANADKSASCMRHDPQPRNRKERFVPIDLLKALPGIRSLIFLPLWDFTEGKYIAGGFIWTSTAGKLMSPDNELPYLKAFGNSIMSEISRVKATKSDIAKTTFIASISHELRSPLHGILGSVEFLQETAVSGYQAGLFASIETCGKTLLDTIDHVLDYAKINKLRKGTVAKRRANFRNGQRKDQVGSSVGLTAEFDLAALVEEVVDAVTAGHVFRRSHQGTVNDQDALLGGVVSMAAEASTLEEAKSTTVDPLVILDLEPRRNWFVRTQPGALRRIVMNLLGNALKYTDAGFVSVSLRVDSETDRQIKVRLRFTDSGRGMSLEFQRTRLFSPFSQEDPFATGTGLGLSIVRQIVDALDGTIAISSTHHVGTDVEVVLALPVAEKTSAATLEPPLEATENKQMCIIEPTELIPGTPGAQETPANKALRLLVETLEDTSKDWFGMNVTNQSSSTQPDFVILPATPRLTADVLHYLRDGPSPRSSSPVIALCSNTGQAAVFRSTVASELLENGIQAIPVTQPLGPRKLAKVIEKFEEEQTRHKQRIVLGREESDPEAIRRERDIMRQVQDAQRAQEENGGSERASVSTTTSDSTDSPAPQRPSLSTIVNGDANAYLQGPTGLPTTTTQNMALARLEMQNAAQRSISAPPPGSLSMAAPGSTSITLPTRAGIEGTARPRILLVDDNEINLQLLVMFMKRQHLPYATANNGLVALETYQNGFNPTTKKTPEDPPTPPTEEPTTLPHTPSPGPRPPPFTHVLMDLSMPIMDGLTSTRRIRAFEAMNQIDPPSAIIALTGLASAEAQEDALKAGINEFLVKPVKFGELKGLLETRR